LKAIRSDLYKMKYKDFVKNNDWEILTRS
jgi:hypothetical protein